MVNLLNRNRSVEVGQFYNDSTSILIREDKTATMLTISNQDLVEVARKINLASDKRPIVLVLQSGQYEEVVTIPKWAVKDARKLLVDAAFELLSGKDVADDRS